MYLVCSFISAFLCLFTFLPLIRLRDERRGQAGVFDGMLHSSHSSREVTASTLPLPLLSTRGGNSWQQRGTVHWARSRSQTHVVAAYQSPIPSKLYVSCSPPLLFSQSSYNITPPHSCVPMYTRGKKPNQIWPFNVRISKWSG